MQVRVNLWDLAGPDEYYEVRNEFYKDAQGALLVYDVTNRASFEMLELWLDEAKRHGATTDMVGGAECIWGRNRSWGCSQRLGRRAKRLQQRCCVFSPQHDQKGREGRCDCAHISVIWTGGRGVSIDSHYSYTVPVLRCSSCGWLRLSGMAPQQTWWVQSALVLVLKTPGRHLAASGCRVLALPTPDADSAWAS